MKKIIRSAASALVSLTVCGAIDAQPQKPPATIEWAFSDSVRRASIIPQTQWLTDNTLLIHDTRVSAPERRFEILDPATGARRVAVDLDVAMRSLRTLLAPASAPAVIGWPDSFDPSGTRGVYFLAGDVFVLHLAQSRFTRITNTPAAERSAEFSPDGSHIAFVRENDLYVVDMATGDETRITRDGSATTLNGTLSWLYWEEIFGRRDIGYWWSPDSRHIAFLQTDESGVDLHTFVDFAPLNPQVHTQRYPKAGRPNPRVRIGVAGTDGASPVTWFRIDDRPFEYILRVKWLPDSRRVSAVTMTRDQREVGVYIADAATGSSRRVVTEMDPGFVNVHDDLHFLPDGEHFLWASERDGNYHLYRYTLDGRLVNQVTRGNWSLASTGGAFWVRRSVAGFTPAWIYVTSMEASPLERQLYRVRPDGSDMTRISREKGTHRISMAPRAQYYTDAYSDARTLPRLTIHRASGDSVATLAVPRPQLLAAVDFQLPDVASIPARDGFQMPARIQRPSRFDPGRRYPVVMAVYGGASSASVVDAWQSDLLFGQVLVDAGFVVVKVDNRSATGRNKTLENLVVGALGDSETADLVDAARWLKTQRWVDTARVGVWGWSNGGYITLQLMTRSKEFKAGIAVAPVTDWRFYDTKWAESLIGMPDANPLAYDSASVVTRAANLHGRLLLIHGTYDDNVHPQHSEAFIDALINAGKTFEMMFYPMRQHGIDDRAANMHVYRTVLEFWQRTL